MKDINVTSILDIELENKYESDKFHLLQQHDRIKLPIVAHNIHANHNYAAINSKLSFPWDAVKQSRLIESLIINIPVLPIVLYDKSYSLHVVIDGKQRLRAIADFYSNKLALTGLEVELELEGYTYANLPTQVRSILSSRSLSFTTVIPKNDLSPDETTRLIKLITERLENK